MSLVLYDELSDPLALRRWDDIDLKIRRDLDALALSRPWPLWDSWTYPRWNRIFNELGTTSIDENKFKVRLDVDPFERHELTVKTVDNQIVVEGRHEERRIGANVIKRQFTRRYFVPDGYDVKDAVSKISTDGILTVEVPRLWWKPLPSRERVLYIERTGPTRWAIE